MTSRRSRGSIRGSASEPGYEWITSSETAPSAFVVVAGRAVPLVTVDTSVSGWQFANVQIGVDYKVSPDLGLGPFVMFSPGEYSVTTPTRRCTAG